jgi:hypothetical protein
MLIDKEERIWKEALLALSRYKSSSFLERLRRSTKNINKYRRYQSKGITVRAVLTDKGNKSDVTEHAQLTVHYQSLTVSDTPRDVARMEAEITDRVKIVAKRLCLYTKTLFFANYTRRTRMFLLLCEQNAPCVACVVMSERVSLHVWTFKNYDVLI